jgi:hypothetical protein
MNASSQRQIALPVACTNEQLAFFAERQKKFRERSVTFDSHDHTQERTTKFGMYLSFFRLDSAPVSYVVKFIKTLTDRWLSIIHRH